MNEADISSIEYLSGTKALEIIFERGAVINIDEVIAFVGDMELVSFTVYEGGKLVYDMVPSATGWMERS